MPSTSLQSRRVPAFVGKRRIPGVFAYTKADGTTTYLLRLRVDGRATWLKLDARTPTEAAEAAAVLRGERAKGELVAVNRSVTFAKLVDEYLAHARIRLAPGTYELYEHRLRTYAVPHFGLRRKAGEITTADCRLLLDKLRDGRIRSSRGVLAPSSQRGVLIALQAVFKFAKKSGIVSRSPLRDLDSDDRPTSTRKRQPRYLGVEQIDALLAEVGEHFRPVLTLVAFSGLRVREALGLRWQDIDFDAGLIHVRGQLNRDGSGWTPVTKTKSSMASVPLLPRVERELRALRAKQATKGIHLVGATSLVFLTGNDRPQSPRNTLRAVYAASEAAGLNGEGKARVCVHDLRHSTVSNALASGFTLPEASRLARHGSVGITADVYADVLEGREAAMGAKLVAGGFGQ